jgi:predicted HicB family RNase H-like nuclease
LSTVIDCIFARFIARPIVVATWRESMRWERRRRYDTVKAVSRTKKDAPVSPERPFVGGFMLRCAPRAHRIVMRS